MASTPSSKTRQPFFFRKKKDPHRIEASSALPLSSTNDIATVTGVTVQAAAPRVPRHYNITTTNRRSIPAAPPSPPPLLTSIQQQQQPIDPVNNEQFPKVKSGLLRSLGKKIKRVFRKKPVSVPSSSSSSGSDSGFAGIVASGLQSASAVGIHRRPAPLQIIHRPTPTAAEIAGVGVAAEVERTGGWPMIGGQLFPPVVIPDRSSSLHAYSVNGEYGGRGREGDGLTIDLIHWNGSMPFSQGSPSEIVQQQCEVSASTLTSLSATASATSSNVAVAGSSTPPIEFLDTNANKPRKTRTRTIARATTDPPITIKLIHTPSPSDVSSPSVISEIPSDSDSDLDSCEGLHDMRGVVEAQTNQRWEPIHAGDGGGVDLFADFDSMNPRLVDEDHTGEDEDEEDTDEQEFHKDDRSTYYDDNDDYDGHGPGSGSGSGPGGDHSSHATEDGDLYGYFPPPPSSEHRFHSSAPAATRRASPKDSSDELSIPEIPSIPSSHSRKNSKRDIEFNNSQRPRYDESSHHNNNATSASKRESIAWLDHYLALTSTYRDNLSTIQLDLFHALHHVLREHFQKVLELQHQILGIHGVGDVQKLDNDYLTDLVSQKLKRRMERDVKDLQRFCWAQGELVQQGFWRTMLTVDYEEEDEFEAGRVDLKERREKERKAREKAKAKGELVEEEEDDEEAVVGKEDEEDEEEKELEKMARRVKERAKLPAVEEWPLFRWTALQKPYATLKDLNEALICMQSTAQHGVVYDTIVPDIVESPVDERKSRESDEDWDSSLAEDSILIRSAEEYHHYQHYHSHDQYGWYGDDDNNGSHLDTAAKRPPASAPARSDIDSDCEYAYPSDGHTNIDSGTSTPPPARAATRSFYMQDPSRCRLEPPIEPIAFSRRPLTPTPPPASQRLETATSDNSSPEANITSATTSSGLNSNTEWMRVVRALAATEVASSAPAGTRLPIWVVYAPPITASTSSSSAVAGVAATPPVTAAADDSVSSEKTSSDYRNRKDRSRRHCDREAQRRRHSSSPTTSSSFFGSGCTRAGKKHQHNGKRDHGRSDVSALTAATAATVVNNHFQGGTHYHYNGSSTTMSVLSRPSSTSSSPSSSSSSADSSSVSDPSVFLALSSDSSPSRRSPSSSSSSKSQQSLEEVEEVGWPTTSSSYTYNLRQQHRQLSSTPLLRRSPCSSSRSTIHEDAVDSNDENEGEDKEEEEKNNIFVFSQHPAALLRNPLPSIPFSKPLPPIPHTATSSYHHSPRPPPLPPRPAHYPGHRPPHGITITIPNSHPPTHPRPSPEASVHNHNPSELTSAFVTVSPTPPMVYRATSRAGRIRVRTSGRPQIPPSPSRTRVYEFGDPSWRLEDFHLTERASLANITVTEGSVIEDAPNDTSDNARAPIIPS